MPGISLSAGVLPNLEAGLRLGAFKAASDEATADLAATVKAGIGTGPIRIAAALAYSALVTADETVDGAGKRGIAFDPAFEFRAGDFAGGLDAGIRYGDARGTFRKSRPARLRGNFRAVCGTARRARALELCRNGRDWHNLHASPND